MLMYNYNKIYKFKQWNIYTGYIPYALQIDKHACEVWNGTPLN